MRRLIPCGNCVEHRFLTNDVVVYGRRVEVRWSGEGFGECNSVLLMPEEPELDYSVLFAAPSGLPVVFAALYRRPDVLENSKAFIVKDVKDFMRCLYEFGEVVVRDLVALNVLLKEEGPGYVYDLESAFEDLLTLSRRLCGGRVEPVENVIVGPEVERIEKIGRCTCGVSRDLVYLYDGTNYVFMEQASTDPFEVGEEYFLVIYGVYSGREYAHVLHLGEEALESEQLLEFLKQNCDNLLRSDGTLRSVESIASAVKSFIETSEEAE